MLSLLLLLVHAPRPVSPDSLPHFRLVLQPIAHGWSARCDSGCSWTDLSFSVQCADDCKMVIDANGVHALGRETPVVTPRFAFVIAQNGGGGSLRGLNGTAWETVDWSCAASRCPATVTERGVSPGAP